MHGLVLLRRVVLDDRHARARGRGHRGPRGLRTHRSAEAWSADDADKAAWLYHRLAPPARELFDLLLAAPSQRIGGEEVAKQLKLDKGAHGVAGILAWPGRYSRRVGRVLPIATEGRADGGTDYYMEPEVAALFTAAQTRRRTSAAVFFVAA